MAWYGDVCFKQKLERTVLPLSPHSPHLSPSHSHLFGALKDDICGKRFGSDDEIIEEVAANIKFELVQEGVDVTVSRWPKAA
jgi:hypothetical protein